jgi:hypothetical protein
MCQCDGYSTRKIGPTNEEHWTYRLMERCVYTSSVLGIMLAIIWLHEQPGRSNSYAQVSSLGS